MTGNQIELTLPVAVCAWCKPNERGSGIGAVSHGICLRHLRQFRLQLECGVTKRRRSRRAEPKHDALLPL